MTRTRLIKAFALANLIFLPAWTEMGPGAGSRYYMGYRVGAFALAALLVNLVLTTGLLHVALRSVERPCSRGVDFLRRTFLFLLAGVALNGIRVGFQDQAYYFNLANQALQLGWVKFLLLYGTPFLALALFIHLQEARFRQWGGLVLMVVSPLPLVLASSFFTEHPPAAPLPPAAAASTTRPKGLTVFMIFDEWDYNWTFPARPARIPMPELDRFKAENLAFTHAYAPTNETFRSIPSLLTGRVVEAARTTPGPDLLLKFKGAPGWTPWSQVDDLPRQLGAQGLRTCFINHFHAFSSAYTEARPLLTLRRKPYFQEWEVGRSRYQTFGGSLARQLRCVLENLPGVNFLWNHEGKVESVPTVYRHALDETLAAIQSRQYDVIITHWPIPHAPVMVDPASGQFSTHPPKGLRLVENLRLVDTTIGRLRQTLEAEGLWDDATVVLTSDHWQRLAADPRQGIPPVEPGVEESRHRVPLLLKWPGASGPRVVDTPVNGVGVARFLAHPEATRSLDQLKVPEGPLGAYSPWIK